MSRYNDLEIACLVDAIDKAALLDSAVTAPDILGILEELANVLDVLQEPLASAALRDIASDVTVLDNNNAKLEAVECDVDTFCSEFLDISESKFREWLKEHAGQKLVVLPLEVDLEDVQAFITQKEEEAEAAKKNGE